MNLRALPDVVLRRLENWPALRWLDRVPFVRALGLGLPLGAGTGVAILFLPAGAQLAVAVAVVVLAGAVALSARPVGIWEAAEEVEPLLDMVAIKGGSFMMGSPEDEPGRYDNEKLHRVELSAFRIGRTTVTNAQYREVMEREKASGPGGDEHPVSEVSWLDAVAFCNRLSEREGLPLCYEIDGDEVSWLEDAGGYRLPTEAEWEYACRAGSTGRWSFGDDERQLERYAWFSGNAGGDSHSVAELDPNAWGLHDMHGNVWEWCWDAYGEYPAESSDNPRGPDNSLGARRARRAPRVLRGGAFGGEPRVLRSAIRGSYVPEFSFPNIGFRCVRRAPHPRPLSQPPLTPARERGATARRKPRS